MVNPCFKMHDKEDSLFLSLSLSLSQKHLEILQTSKPLATTTLTPPAAAILYIIIYFGVWECVLCMFVLKQIKSIGYNVYVMHQGNRLVWTSMHASANTYAGWELSQACMQTDTHIYYTNTVNTPTNAEITCPVQNKQTCTQITRISAQEKLIHAHIHVDGTYIHTNIVYTLPHWSWQAYHPFRQMIFAQFRFLSLSQIPKCVVRLVREAACWTHLRRRLLSCECHSVK